MKVSRKILNNAFSSDWCIHCGMASTHTPIRTGLPGIAAKVCQRCNYAYQANFLESDDDEIEIEDGMILPPEVMP